MFRILAVILWQFWHKSSFAIAAIAAKFATDIALRI